MTWWALTILLTLDAAALPPVSWHATHAACERQAALEVWHLETTGRPVSAALCTPHRIPRLRPITGEIR